MAIPVIAASVLGALLARLIQWMIFKFIASIGLSIITFVAVDSVMNLVFDFIFEAIAALDDSSIMIAIIAKSQILLCAQIITSAIAAKFAILQAMGFYKKMSFGGYE